MSGTYPDKGVNSLVPDEAIPKVPKKHLTVLIDILGLIDVSTVCRIVFLEVKRRSGIKTPKDASLVPPQMVNQTVDNFNIEGIKEEKYIFSPSKTKG